MTPELKTYLKTFLTENRRQLFERVLAERTRHFTVVTEDVYQLHNTSAVMRSCDIFGIQDLHVVEDLEGKRIDKEIAKGAQKWVSLHRHSDIGSCITQLKQQDYRIIATTPHESSALLPDFDTSHKAAFFFGKESDGLSEEVFRQADGFLKIPMYGFTESLNISVAVAIVLNTVITRLKASRIDWRLSPEERNTIETQWIRNSIRSVDRIIERYQQEKNFPSGDKNP